MILHTLPRTTCRLSVELLITARAQCLLDVGRATHFVPPRPSHQHPVAPPDSSTCPAAATPAAAGAGSKPGCPRAPRPRRRRRPPPARRRRGQPLFFPSLSPCSGLLPLAGPKVLARDRAPRPFYSRTTKLVNAWKVLPCCRQTAARCARAASREQRRRWLKFGRRRDRRAAQDRSGKARTSPTHPSGGISRGARDGRRQSHGGRPVGFKSSHRLSARQLALAPLPCPRRFGTAT